MLSNYPKQSKSEDSANDVVHRSMGKRRTSHQSSEHDLDEQINEWANMTWFLVALGGVCLQRKPRSNRPHYGPPNQSAMPRDLQAHPGLLMSCSTSSSLCTGGSTSPAAATAAGAAALGAVGPAVSGAAMQSSNASTSSASNTGRGTYQSVFGGPVVQEVTYCPVTQ